MKIFSVDPGYDRLGVAIIEIRDKKETLLFSDCITTDKKLPHHRRLLLIGEAIKEIIDIWEPDEFAIETLFFKENRKSALLVAEAFGVVVYEVAQKNIPVFLYSPMEVKIAVTSYGRSDKNHVKSMVERLVKIEKVTRSNILDDEYDAIAIGLTHNASRKNRLA